MNTQTKELIDRLVNAVNVDINYKDKMFFDTLEKNNILVFKDENMRNISFNDVKYAYESNDTPENKLMEQFIELENKYIDSKTIKGLQANEKFYAGFEALGIDIKEEIYEAFDNFTGEILDTEKMVEKRIKSSSDYAKKTVSSYIPKNLVYEAEVKTSNCSSRHKQEEFQFPTLMILLDVLSKSMICHALKLYSDNKLVEAGLKGQTFSSAVDLFDEYYKLNMTNMPSKAGNVVVPMLVRKILALTCYILTYFGNSISIKSKRGPLIEKTGVNANVMEEMFLITSDLGYPLFTKKGKMFVHDKWSIYPEKMFKEESYIPPSSPITYLGNKQGWLGYVINKLQAQVPYDRFIDIFGGSGVSIVQFPHNNDSEYYINDFHYANVCYYKILKADEEKFNEFLDCLEDISEALKIVTTRYSGNKIINKITKDLYNIYDYVSDVCVDSDKQDIITTGKIKTDFEDAINNIADTKGAYKCDFDYEVIIASVFFAYGTMTMSGEISEAINSSNNGTIRKFTKLSRKEIEDLFRPIRKVYKDIKILKPLGGDAMNLLATKEINNEGTLVYLDSPYLETMGYNANKSTQKTKIRKKLLSTDYGKSLINNNFPMDKLLDAVDNFKGDYIFSCRLAMPKSIDVFFHYKKGKCLVTYSNYIWYFKRWAQMHNIDDIYMYCLYDKEWNAGVKNNPSDFYAKDINYDIYFDSRGTEYNAKKRSSLFPVDEMFKDKFINSDWELEDNGIDIRKEDLFEYFRFVIFGEKNYEVFITNRKYKTPNFYEMYEYIKGNNLYKKKYDNIGRKYNEDKSKKGSGDREILIPDSGAFIRIPMSVVCEFIEKIVDLDEFKQTTVYTI